MGYDIIWVIAIIGAALVSYGVAVMLFRIQLKQFMDEMHYQYLVLLRKHGIKLNKKGEKILYESDNRQRRKKDLLHVRKKNRSPSNSRTRNS